MKGNRYHDDILTIGRLQLIIRAEEHRDNTIGLFENEQFIWAVFHKFKIRWWKYK